MSLAPAPRGTDRYLLRPDYLGLARFKTEPREDVLGAVLFGHPADVDLPGVVPIPLCPIDNVPLIERWRGRAPVTRGSDGTVHYAHDGVALFASIACDERLGIERVAEDAYHRLLAVVERLGYRHVLRAWNHFPDLHGEEDGLARYRRFNIGRHRAFGPRLAQGWLRPAATVIGTHAPGFHVYLLATVHPGTMVDNPRQTRPFCYPLQYGPQPPDFSRAVIADLDGTRHLFVSGTAAILGHASQSPADPVGQVEEMLANLRAVLHAAGVAEASPGITATKVYVGGVDPARTAARVAARFVGSAPVYLCGEVCRPELVVEVEAVAAPFAVSMPDPAG